MEFGVIFHITHQSLITKIKSFVHLFKTNASVCLGGGSQGGNAPLSSLASDETPLASQNGGWGEKSDSFSRGGKQDCRPLSQLRNKFISKTFQWNVFDVLCYIAHQPAFFFLLSKTTLATAESRSSNPNSTKLFKKQ